MIDLALSACRVRQSPRTGFLHQGDTIPLFENFCFAFALFRKQTKEAFLEGKALLERLLAFQTPEGNFPLYLHDYPRCFDRLFPLKIAPILFHALRDFPQQLKATPALERLLAYAKDLGPLAPLWEMRRQALLGNAAPFEPKTAHEWFEWLISRQLLAQELTLEIPYSKEIQAFLGEHPLQEGPEPQPVPIEWLCAQENFSPRLLKDHPHQIHTALLFPASIREIPPTPTQGLRLLWPGATLHSLFCSTGTPDQNRLFFTFDRPPEEESEIALYCDLSPETTLLINGQKGTLFHLGDTVTLVTPSRQFEIQFQLLEGEGDFVGHLSQANRPSQLRKEGVYDWKITLRTLRRSDRCTLSAEIRPKMAV